MTRKIYSNRSNQNSKAYLMYWPTSSKDQKKILLKSNNKMKQAVKDKKPSMIPSKSELK